LKEEWSANYSSAPPTFQEEELGKAQGLRLLFRMILAISKLQNSPFLSFSFSFCSHSHILGIAHI
jgi:hypothetical protein